MIRNLSGPLLIITDGVVARILPWRGDLQGKSLENYRRLRTIRARNVNVTVPSP